MSKVQPTRPGAPRRPGISVPQTAQNTSSRGFSAEDILNLPTFEDDGTPVDMDPEKGYSAMADETATIADAKFVLRTFRNKEGKPTYNRNGELNQPDISLQIFFRRDEDESGDYPKRQEYKYAGAEKFSVSKDGQRVVVRKAVLKDGQRPPILSSKTQGARFLRSIQLAGGNNVIEKVNKEGIQALVGLRVHVRLQKTADMRDDARDILLVDYIDGVEKPTAGSATTKVPSASTQTVHQSSANQAPVNQASVNQTAPVNQATSVPAAATSAVDGLAGEALLDIIEQAEGNSISRAQIPTTLIRLEKWKSHEHRGAILKTLRDDAFINREGQPWKVSGNNVSL